MKKKDLKKELAFYSAKRKPALVEAPAMNFLMIDGQGDPNTSVDYQQAIEALYSVSYTLKFMVKQGEPAIDYGVMPLEGLWWADEMDDFLSAKKENWRWTSMIMQPDFITEKMVREARNKAAAKKALPALEKMRFEKYEEGRAVQVLHLGPFSEEGPVIEALHAFAQAEGYALRGRHHEIYLNDFRRVAPERMKTIIRQPVE